MNIKNGTLPGGFAAGLKALREKSKSRTVKKPSSVLHLLGFYYISILWLEIVFRISNGEKLFSSGVFYTLIFSLPAAVLLFLLTSLFPRAWNVRIATGILIFLTLLFSAQTVYHAIFETYFTIYLAATGARALGFVGLVVSGILRRLAAILFFCLPLAVHCFWGRRRLFFNQPRGMTLALFAAALAVLHLFAMFTLVFSSRDYGSAYSLYFKTNNVDYSVDKLGLLTTMRLDLKRGIFGFTETAETFVETPAESAELAQPSAENAEPAKIYPKNIMDIDFDALAAGTTNSELKAMHEYFKTVEPTSQNEKTGQFEGHNLILITAESFAPYAVSEEMTPTLYKMMNEGYNFSNFYNPLWAGSTLAGEYAVCSGLLPKYDDGVQSFRTMAGNLFYFALGNQFGRKDYLTYAFHANTYNYYSRDITHPSMGYTYLGKGNGLTLEHPNYWPQSDDETIDASADYFIGKDQPFHVYYMSISGHCSYDFVGNMMAYKNKDAVANLPYSEEAKAYIACNIEFDKAMENLLARLEAAGIADKTVIAITPDHYPYELSRSAISELLGHTVEPDFELYKSVFFIYEKGMTPEVIDKPCSGVDVLPTLSNLMGLEYDSRLLSGRDIFSDAEAIVYFKGRSWLTEKAMYIASGRTVSALGGAEVDDAYVERINGIVSNRFVYAAKILDTDYYKVLFGNNG